MENEEKYKFRFNPKSNRLENFDYSSCGVYFITICTKDREHFFGEIENEEMVLNEIGKYAKDEIENIPMHRKNVILDEYVVMPNHIHMILFLEDDEMLHKREMFPKREMFTKREMFPKREMFTKREMFPKREMFHRNISTVGEDCDNFSEEYYSNISPQKNDLGNIIKLFKSFFTKNINRQQNEIYFSWQRNYYDRIVRNEEELQRIRKYIIENPLKWEIDKNNTEGILM